MSDLFNRFGLALDHHPILAATVGAAVFGLGWAFDRALRAGRALNWQLIRELLLANGAALIVTGAVVEVWHIGPMVAAGCCALVNMLGTVTIDRLTNAAADRAEEMVREFGKVGPDKHEEPKV